MITRHRTIHLAQILALLAGSIFAWYTIIGDFMRFYGFEGTIWKVKDCVIPNPVTTACFYGGICFVIALVWAIWIAIKTDGEKTKKQEKGMLYLLIAGSLFGWGNFSYFGIRYWMSKGTTTGCSGLLQNPIHTPCFYGSLLFTLSLVVTIVLVVMMRRKAMVVNNTTPNQPTTTV